MHNSSRVKGLRRKTTSAIRAAGHGRLGTVARCGRPVSQVVSDARADAILETIELLAEVDFTRQYTRLRAGKLKFYAAATLAD
jgi:hypothetical protein